jgi:hypothetical protein
MYKIGVEIAMHGNASSFLGMIVKDLIGMNGHVNNAVAGLGRVKLALAGVGTIMAGGAILGGMNSLVEHGNKLVKVQQDMAQAGASQVEVQEALKESTRLTGIYRNMGVTETMKLINDSRGIFGDMKEGIHFAESVTKSGSFLKAYMGDEHGKNAEAGLRKELDAALKSGELSSKLSRSEMDAHIQELTAMKVAFGDQLKIGQYLTAQRSAKQSLRSADDDFRYGMFPAMVQENGSNAGTMLMTAFNKIVNGTGNRSKSLEKMAEIGLLNADQIDYGKDGHAKGLKDANAIKNNKEAAINFASYVNGTIRPLLEKKMNDEGVKGDLDRQIRMGQLVGQMWPDRNAAQAISEMLQQFTKFSKDAGLIKTAHDKLQNGGSGAYVNKSYEGQKQAFETQWTNTLELAGAPLVGRATEMLKGLNGALSGVTQWLANADPAKIKMAGAALTGLGAGLVALGAVLLGGALFAAIGLGGWLVVGLAAVAAGFAAFGVNFASFKKGWDALADCGPAIATIATKIGGMLSAAIASIPGYCLDAIKGMASSIGSAIAGALPSASSILHKFGIGHGDAAPSSSPVPGKQSSNGPTMSGTQKQAVNGNVYMDGKAVGRVALNSVARSETRVGSISGHDTSLHPDYASA